MNEVPVGERAIAVVTDRTFGINSWRVGAGEIHINRGRQHGIVGNSVVVPVNWRSNSRSLETDFQSSTGIRTVAMKLRGLGRRSRGCVISDPIGCSTERVRL